ncbi:MAG: type II toxin-antitoxin system HicA family toxin [bacterium]|nr:type II toxin-antitoxin system HicA family toxin [bacterium]
MPKLPRDLSGQELIKLLKKYNYTVTRQAGSHIRLTSNHMGFKHDITIPDHPYLKIGTLNSILQDLAACLKTDKDSLIKELFQ